ncbi:MAG: extracellular solute-binding protein [Pseudomonadota bacterium]
MTSGVSLSRRDLLGFGLSGVAMLGIGSSPSLQAMERRDAFSPLGALKYPPGFQAFDYVNARAPKGGRLRLARMGAFDTTNTLTYPGRPAGEMRLIYDHLLVASADEVASYYGLLAKEFDVASDFSTITFDLHDGASWHDGRPVLADDVVFTFKTLKQEGAPFYRQALRPLTVVKDGPRRVVFRNERAGDRDILRKIATIPIHPAHFWGNPSDAKEKIPLGSGPYRITSVDAPRRFVLTRAADYWGVDIPVNRGRWNFDSLVFEYFREATVALEAFKADEYDVRTEPDPKRWQSGYAGPALSSGAVLRSETGQLGSGGLHGIVFNLRRPPLNDKRVRIALTLAYDFEAVNRTLFGGYHQRFDSVFGTSDLRARGRAGLEERQILKAFDAELEPVVLDDPNPLAAFPRAGTREALRQASQLLNDAGYPVKDGKRVSEVDGLPLELELVSPNPLYKRPIAWLERAWKPLGIDLSWRQTDAASAARRMLDRDFDLALLSWTPARLPGTAERLLWHGALAASPSSYALSGINSPSLDATIEALEAARDPKELQVAGRAFDRVFRHTLVLLPLWRDSMIRIAWWDRFNRPEAEKEGFPPSPIDRWWGR